jgi:hypothetical protein
MSEELYEVEARDLPQKGLAWSDDHPLYSHILSSQPLSQVRSTRFSTETLGCLLLAYFEVYGVTPDAVDQSLP